eukprot:5268445-Lingulodinium_polyedra.AAC.1
MCAGSWGAVVKVCEARGLLVELSQPGVPHNNARVERGNQDLVDGLGATMIADGLPACVWSFAAPCYAHFDNVVVSE